MDSDWETTGEVVKGRPDLHGDNRFGVTMLKRHQAYVFSTGANASLVHRVSHVEVRWYVPVDGGRNLGRLKRPHVTFHSVCGQMFYVNRSFLRRRTRTQTCAVPAPDAVRCGRCHGAPASFGPHGEATRTGIDRKAAHARLGCVMEAK